MGDAEDLAAQIARTDQSQSQWADYFAAHPHMLLVVEACIQAHERACETGVATDNARLVGGLMSLGYARIYEELEQRRIDGGNDEKDCGLSE